MNLDNIPKYLKENASWCLWKKEVRNGKVTKVPISPVTKGYASVNNPSTFTSFNNAVNNLGSFDGLGIRVDGNLVAIDVDDCVVNGDLNDYALEIVNHFPNSYIEFSPSGKGLRIFTFLPNTITYNTDLYKMKTKEVEVYVAGFTNRFVTVTGDFYQDGEIVEESGGLMWLLEKYLKREKDNTTTTQDFKSYLTDEEIIEKASNATNKEKFLSLWTGNIEDYTSTSEADLALTSILAFYAGGDYGQIDRLFRKSKLFREKWDEQRGSKTYGEITIEKAISSLKEVYSTLPKLDASLEFGIEKLKEMGLPLSSKYSWTDIGSGRIFADFYKDKLRFVPERKSWYFYEDGIWIQDTGNLKAMKLCMKLANLLHILALDIEDEHKRKAYVKFSNRWQARGYRVSVLKDAEVHHPLNVSDFDKDPYLLNCMNGTLNLKAMEFYDHRSSDYLSKMADVIYDPYSTNDRWNRYIDEIMSADQEKAKFLQKILGYGLTGDTRHECMMVLYGMTTRNGKGTLCESILKVLGTYACASRPETLALKNKVSSSGPSEDIARLAGVRFVNIPEPGKGLVLNVAQVKSMTGNDTINARFLHENSFDFRPQFKIYINTNYLPIVNDVTIFTSGRMLIIPFDRHFTEEEQDKTLKSEFAKEEVKSAILNWLIEGYKLLQKEGLTIPNSVKDATLKYQKESDKIAIFMEDCLEEGKDYEVRTSEVYERYRSWSLENGYYLESMKTFKQSLESKATIKRKRPKDGKHKTTVLIGYRLISEFL
ncbi:phage/plasmid primase, P4 family [Miniphocaeibacter halophilus]|uniref:Nucleoside triphosphatase n=1 Tax=Miniphocaeibacter halophilus TaxID=2931922 RepID=A0AC61N0L7_9FIRM|nr:phage/plasmid primase, P4 family [Miniphocaeibacter halophilus]QQK08836.1 nucleoside triphosphatase [Miniphocaeibacter halophilus]